MRTVWCPSCRAEYYATVSECADCHVPLVEELVAVVEEPRAEPHIERRRDLSTLSLDQRRALDWLLDGREVPYGWSDGVLITESAHDDTVDDLVEFITAEPEPGPRDETFSRVAARSHRSGDMRPPHPRRLFAVWVDGLVVGIIATSLRGGVSGVALRLGVVAVAVVYATMTVAYFGATAGKAIVGLRVVEFPTGGRVPWSAAAIRAFVPAAPVLLLFVGGFAAAVLGTAWTVTVYAPILIREDRRGLHDLAAATMLRRRPAR